MNSFKEGYSFFLDNTGGQLAAEIGGKSGEYIAEINDKISELEDSINGFQGEQTDLYRLQGDVFEFWHGGTYNVMAAVEGSENRATVLRSHGLGSIDISLNDGSAYGAKSYSDGAKSAIAQAKSIFQRYREYQANGGGEKLDEYLSKRGLPNQSALYDALYQGQWRLIPKGQMDEAREALRRMIATEEARRPEQVPRLQDTLDHLRDRIIDSDGVESVPISREDAQRLALLAARGEFDASNMPEIQAVIMHEIKFSLQEDLKAGLSAALLSMILRVAPELINAIDYQLHMGAFDEAEFRKIGMNALSGAPRDFVRGSMAAAITEMCHGGLLGESLKSVSPSIIAAMTTLTLRTTYNAYRMASGEITSTDLTNSFVRDVFLSSCYVGGGLLLQSLSPVLPGISFMLGSFIGSAVGGFVFSRGYSIAISFCISSGFTMFGLVQQDYQLPREVLENLGIKLFDYEKFQYSHFEPLRFKPKQISTDVIVPNSFDVRIISRGVIGIARIGYI